MSTPVDLKTQEGLRAALTAPDLASDAANVDLWVKRLSGVLEWFANADVDTRSSRDFQWKLWEENGVAGIGMGTVTITQAIDDEGFRVWLANRSSEPCPTEPTAAGAFLEELYGALRERFRPFSQRTPRLKIFRVLAVLYPHVMTTVANPDALADLVAHLGGAASLGKAERHAWVRGRVDEALGPVASGWEAMARRLILPWLLYEKYVSPSAPEVLVPLPAAERFRGLTATRGMLPATLKTLAFVKDGVTRKELLDFLSVESPDAKASSLGIVVNGLRSELGVTRNEGKRIVLTPRGRSLLETGDPDVLSEWILKRILGPDWLLARLRDRGPLPTSEYVSFMQQVNAGWTTNAMPNNIRAWLLSLGVVESVDKSLRLTERGKEWAKAITWHPEALSAPKADPEPTPDTQPGVSVAVPAVLDIVPRVQGGGAFETALVARLHSAVWAHERRHFAVLAGLSGAGKTLLARSYASAIASGDDGERHLTVPVQPGWHDPGALLGYVNPLRGDSYVRTAFLELLLRAVRDPERPYVVVLDEMNLSHPEQYMAPLLSAMETGAAIQLHSEGDTFDGVDAIVPYPCNLVIMGTLNLDETTHGLSDKVLDRAFVVEFWDVDLDAYPRWGSSGLAGAQEQRVRELLGELMTVLAPVRLHFGWRVVDDVVDFLRHAGAQGKLLPFEQALDDVIYAKVLPKIRGEDSPRFRAALDSLVDGLTKQGLTRSAGKVRSLRETLLATGTTSFWR